MTQWYYADKNNERQGPVEAGVIRDKLSRRELNQDTLLWRDGMAQWQPVASVQAELAAAERPPFTPVEPPAATAAESSRISDAPASPYAAPSSTLSVGDGTVASAVDGEIVYAGFWKRVAANIIDGMLVNAVSFAVMMIIAPIFGLSALSMFGIPEGGWANPEAAVGLTAFEVILQLVLMALTMMYFAWFHSSQHMASLGKMAVGLAQAFNALHRQGVDLNGKAGEDFFALGTALGVPHAKNAGDAGVNIHYADINAMTGDDYQVSFDGSQYTVTRLPANTEVWRGAMPAVIDGLELKLAGAPAAGDTWLLQPTRDAAKQLHVVITDPAKVAAADAKGGTANGEIALQLAKLREQKIMGHGTVSLTEAYSQLVSKGAVKTQQIATAAKAQANLISLSYQAQQQVSGVNLNEEYVNIERYQEQFRAAAQVIDAGTRMFDTLLGLRQ